MLKRKVFAIMLILAGIVGLFLPLMPGIVFIVAGYLILVKKI